MRKARSELEKKEEGNKREQDTPGEAGYLQCVWGSAIPELKSQGRTEEQEGVLLISSAGSPCAGKQRNYVEQKRLRAGS